MHINKGLIIFLGHETEPFSRLPVPNLKANPSFHFPAMLALGRQIWHQLVR